MRGELRVSMKTTDRIRVISFIAMWMVVVIHFPLVAGAGTSFSIVRDALTQWAVPWFFFVSGAFAARSLAKHGWREFSVKKFWGLIVPYVIWMYLPRLAELHNSMLWYLHSLIVFMAFTLLFDKILARLGYARRLVVATCMLVGIFGLHRLGVSDLIGTPTSPFYFAGGYLLSDWFIERDIGHSVAQHSWVIALVVVLAIVLRLLWFVLHLQGVPEMFVRNLAAVTTASALWLIFARFDRADVEIPQWMRATFFVYCCHGPILMLVGRLGWSCPFGAYFFAAPLVFFLFAAVIRRVCPRVYGILSGGR